MRHSKLIIATAILCACVLLSGTALAENTLTGLWDSGCDLLFHTDNVTVSGEASFTLDGEWFKTARLHYVQDGYCSFYELKLLSPRLDGTKRETGWTIIADDEENVYVMDAFYPGTYREGSDMAQNSLLRRSVQLDALTELGGFLVEQLELTLPEGVVTVSDSSARICFTDGQLPGAAVSALNVAAGFLVDRWFLYSHDRTIGDYELAFDSYITVTEALSYGTVRWTLHDADVEIATDDQGRLSAARGSVKVSSEFWDGAVREIEVQFDFTVTDYGSSSVKPFDPAEYHVTPQQYDD